MDTQSSSPDNVPTPTPIHTALAALDAQFPGAAKIVVRRLATLDFSPQQTAKDCEALGVSSWDKVNEAAWQNLGPLGVITPFGLNGLAVADAITDPDYGLDESTLDELDFQSEAVKKFVFDTLRPN
jgi:hypothetical protein